MTALLLAMGLWFGAAQQTAPDIMTVEYTVTTRSIPFTDNLVIDQVDNIKVYLAED